MQQKDSKKILQLIKGASIGLVCLFLTILMFTFMIYKGVVSDGFFIPFILISTLLSGLITGYASSIKLRKNGLIDGMISAVIPAVFLLVSMIIANGGFNISLLIPIAIIVISSASGGIIAVNIKRKNKRK